MGKSPEELGRFEDRTVTLRDGRSVRVRRGGVGDAAAFREYLLRACVTSDQIGLYADEVESVEDMERSLRRRDPSTGGLLLLAEDAPGRIIADCSLNTQPRRKLAGVMTLGMLCDEGWRGLGLGGAMLRMAIDWARADPVARLIELSVLDTNPRARALYESVGFTPNGRRAERMVQEDGSLVGDVLMSLDVRSRSA